MIKVSIIIPTFNRIERLSRAVKSVLNQQLDSFEIIIVDDYTLDQTQKIKIIFDGIPEVNVVKSWKHSPSGARNIGVLSAKGEYITFLDDDDVYLEGRLKNMLSYFESCKEELSFVSSGRIFEVNDFEEIYNDNSQKFGKIVLDDVLTNNGIDIGFLMKRSFFLKLNGFDESLSSLEDWDIIIRALLVFDGYKLKRLDYAVNSESDRDRVSNNQEITRNNLADKFKYKFGKKWYFENKFRGGCESGNFDPVIFIKTFFYCKKIITLKIALRYLIKRGNSL